MHVLINNEIVIKTISISKDKEQLIWDELEKDHHVVKMPAHWIVSIQPYHTIEDVRAVYDLLTAHGISNSVVYKRMALSFAKDDVDSQYTACIVASDTFKQIGGSANYYATIINENYLVHNEFSSRRSMYNYKERDYFMCKFAMYIGCVALIKLIKRSGDTCVFFVELFAIKANHTWDDKLNSVMRTGYTREFSISNNSSRNIGIIDKAIEILNFDQKKTVVLDELRRESEYAVDRILKNADAKGDENYSAKDIDKYIKARPENSITITFPNLIYHTLFVGYNAEDSEDLKAQFPNASPIKYSWRRQDKKGREQHKAIQPKRFKRYKITGNYSNGQPFEEMSYQVPTRVHELIVQNLSLKYAIDEYFKNNPELYDNIRSYISSFETYFNTNPQMIVCTDNTGSNAQSNVWKNENVEGSVDPSSPDEKSETASSDAVENANDIPENFEESVDTAWGDMSEDEIPIPDAATCVVNA